MNAFSRRDIVKGMALGMASVTGTAALGRASRFPFFDGRHRKIGLQLYTLGDEVAADPAGAFAKLAAIGFRDLELPGLYGLAPAALKSAADAQGLSFSSIHVPAPGFGQPGSFTLGSPTQEIVDTLGLLGVTSAVVPIASLPAGSQRKDGEDFAGLIARALTECGPDHWKHLADILNERGAALKPFGISLGYHNHNMEFAPSGSSTGWDILVRNTAPDLVHFELDLGWIAASGQDPVRFLEQHAGRVRWLHLKDIKRTTSPNFELKMDPTEVGSGQQDWPRILTAARDAGIERYYVEQEAPFTLPRMEAARRSFAYLSSVRC